MGWILFSKPVQLHPTPTYTQEVGGGGSTDPEDDKDIHVYMKSTHIVMISR